MKQITLLFSLLFIVFTSCQKTETEFTPNASGDKSSLSTPITKANIGPVPNRFTQKVLLEGFTSANEGTSPLAHDKMDNLVLTSGGKIIGVNIHTNDALSSTMYNSLIDVFTLQHEVPSGMINRGLGQFSSSYSHAPTDWNGAVIKELQTNPACGLAIRAHAINNTATIDVHVGFADAVNENLTVNVYLVEHDMNGVGIGFDQVNSYNTDNRSTFFNMGNPIIGYQHNHVLRAVLTPTFGTDIATHIQSPGGEQVFNFTANVTGYDLTKTDVVAFISQETIGSSIGKVLNAQSARLNSLKSWD